VYWSKKLKELPCSLKEKSVSQNIFCWEVLFRNVFSPKAAGWTHPQAFGNHENNENHVLPRFGNFVQQNGPDQGAIKLLTIFPLISVQSILYQLPYGAFFGGVRGGLSNIFQKNILGRAKSGVPEARVLTPETQLVVGVVAFFASNDDGSRKPNVDFPKPITNS
jgi:hypothetical protein